MYFIYRYELGWIYSGEMGGVDWLNTFDSEEENNDFREFMHPWTLLPLRAGNL